LPFSVLPLFQAGAYGSSPTQQAITHILPVCSFHCILHKQNCGRVQSTSQTAETEEGRCC